MSRRCVFSTLVPAMVPLFALFIVPQPEQFLTRLFCVLVALFLSVLFIRLGFLSECCSPSGGDDE